MNASPEITGYILAGGKSSRMGSDKGLLTLHRKVLVEHVIGQLKSCVRDICIVSDNESYSRFNLEVIPDLVKGIGPAGGILTALNHTKTEKNIILSCDIPFIRRETILHILQHSGQTAITIPVVNNLMEPLVGIYSRSCLEEWKKATENGMYKLSDIISLFSFQLVPVDVTNGINDFFNINTPGDLKRAENN